jgi:hypothetical protein
VKHTIITELRSDVANRVRAELAIEGGRYANVVVVTEGEETVSETIANALAPMEGQGGRGGLAVIVAFPRVRRIERDLEGPPGQLRPSLFVACNPLVNSDATAGTEILPETLAHLLCSRLHGVKLNDDVDELRGDPDAIKKASIEGIPLALEVPFDCRDVTADPINIVAPVVMAPASGSAAAVTLTCATAGAEIWFTTNGNLPGKGVTGATLYTAPVAISAPTTLRAAAYKAGWIGSAVTKSLFTPA